jgi:hypothetical protein
MLARVSQDDREIKYGVPGSGRRGRSRSRRCHEGCQKLAGNGVAGTIRGAWAKAKKGDNGE